MSLFVSTSHWNDNDTISAAFIAYLIGLQLFLLYVRIQAKRHNDLTTIELSNPLSSILQSQMGDGNGMMKSLASSFLSSSSTVVEYDLKQARNMQSGLLMNMLFMWFLHFKMNQVQPLIVQSITGVASMIYSPLFQVYVLGRNLERPFKTPTLSKPSEATKEETDGTVKEVKVVEEVTVTTSKAKKDDVSDGEDGATKKRKVTKTKKVVIEPVVEIKTVEVEATDSSGSDDDDDDDEEEED
jgi:hypothetical protein